MDEKPRELSTADLARTAEDARGHSDEHVMNRSLSPASESTPDALPENPATAGAPSAAVAPRSSSPAPTEPRRGFDGQGRFALFPDDEAERLRTRWSEVQATFVDAPRDSVERADALVAEAMKRLAEIFATERSGLERQWDRGEDVTTEDLRLALQRYRAFFGRLLSM